MTKYTILEAFTNVYGLIEQLDLGHYELIADFRDGALVRSTHTNEIYDFTYTI